MQLVYSFCALGLLLSPISQADCSSASKQAALNFMNSYTQYFKEDQPDPDKWVATSEALTPGFKAAYKQLIEHAKKADPELGLGFDPIIDGQDSPDKFTEVTSCKEKSGIMLVKGSWEGANEGMEVAIKPIKIKTQWLIDGAGIVNIPEKEQAAR
ncbi:hypothetical protein [uncultured Thiothrix sp.]|uniref:hypothetical protein n=1 Tax=uncultured Thiothrix sp. TaxID=223185 RepID=UPI0026158196|nr:hypothetical protein [uncultured Thiothrix sp.]